MARTLYFVAKPIPARARLGLTARQQAIRIARDLQVLSRLAPECVDLIAHCAADLRVRAELAAGAPSKRIARLLVWLSLLLGPCLVV
jgi:hypothetical protein